MIRGRVNVNREAIRRLRVRGFQDYLFLYAGEESLLGTEILNRNELRIEVTPSGMVEIRELP
jgi:hypothetical protein